MTYYFKKIKKDSRACPAKFCEAKRSGGFVVLFSVVLSSIVLAIALGIVNIAVHELNFDTSARNTNEAFFASDTAIECALYYDLKEEGTSFGVPSTSLETNCGGTYVDLNNGSSVPSPSPWSYVLYNLGASKKACAIVTVNKTTNPDSTTILSKGYSTGGDNPNCFSTNQNRVERELLVQIGDAGAPVPPNNHTLYVNVIGQGNVLSNPSGINCGGDCDENYPNTTPVLLTATADAGYVFSGWTGGACTEDPVSPVCTVVMLADVTVTATFNAISSYPTIESVASSSVNSNLWDHTVNLPLPTAGDGTGDLLLVFFSIDGVPDLSLWPAGWTQLMEVSTQSAYETLAVYAKIADGSEGSNFTFTIGGSNPEQSAHRSYRISGHSHTPAYLPLVSYFTSDPAQGGPGANANPDSPSLTIPGAVKKTLWISATGRENGTYTTNNYPAGYTNEATTQTANGNFGSTISTSTINLEASSENPGAYTISNNDLWVAVTVGVQGQ